ncbi:TPA: hypothetical protein ACMUZ8_003328 [Clostridioides difficile]|uniref:hypothetical protein n=2 Tax=Clostridioides difficile TaxID=1496 RepID=UPI001027F84D|nr:hypothetical protein [Clostridioides difficile]MCH7253756.1 hypothetical protein [Clostridioides difficile]MDB6307169.1 hypothetical protein [Clostridioides difficile]VFH05470.1 Uncharacterised protein [Clostridioides difficile]VFH07322.1 Uncharacterised protein [Clostridioides difficile]
MASSMNSFNLPDMRKYTKNIAFNPFEGGRQSFEWSGNNHGLQGSSKDTCLSCTYNGSTINWGSGNVWVLGGYGQYTFTYNCESMHVDTQQKFPYTSNRIITIKGRPVISGSDTSLGNKRKGFSVDFTVSDDTPDVNLIVRVYLDDKLIQNITPVVQNSTLTATVTDSQLNSLSVDGNHKLKIQLNDGYDNFDRIFTFKKIEKGINISTSLVTDSQAKFTVTKTYSELTKIEWYLDEVLKDTFTTDLYSEKTINYELTDNAIHTLRIVATDAENATAEKVLSISKEIMPLQEDASLQDISTKLIEIGEGFKNGKASIINTLALKNIEASLNNTLVELSEKIKTSFDSSDASVQDLMNQLTQANNTISQLNTKYKFAYSLDLTVHWFIDCGFKPDFVIYECINKHGKFLVFLTPFNYSVFDIGNLGWTITAREDISKKDSFSMNDINQFWGTKIRDTGFNNADMPKDSLNDRYVFWIAIKCL